MKSLAFLFAFAFVFVGSVTAQDPDLSEGERKLLEPLLEEGVISQADFDKRVKAAESQDAELSEEQVELLESLLKDGVISQAEFDERTGRRSLPADDEVSDSERRVLEDLLKGGVITQEQFNNLVDGVEIDSVMEKDDIAPPLSVNDGQDVVSQKGFGFFLSKVELGELDATFTYDGFLIGPDSFTYKDVERKRTGVQYMFGDGSRGGVLRAFTEELSHSAFNFPLDGYGLGVFGWSQTPTGGMSEDSSTFFELMGGIDFTFGAGKEDIDFYDPWGSFLFSAPDDWAVNYYDIHARAGIGTFADEDLSISGGLNLSMVEGDLQQGLDGLGNVDTSFSATNYGFYVGAQVGPGVRFDLLFGDIVGFAFSVGTSF